MISGTLYGLSILQLGVGVYLCVYAALNPRTSLPSLHPESMMSTFLVVELPQFDLDSYRICLFQISTFGSLLYTSLSLVFGALDPHSGGKFRESNRWFVDLGVFLITFLRLRTLRTQRRSSSIPNILDTVAGDTATYFLVIFSSHFALVLTLTLVRVCACNVVSIRSFSFVLPSSLCCGSCQPCKFHANNNVQSCSSPLTAFPFSRSSGNVMYVHNRPSIAF